MAATAKSTLWSPTNGTSAPRLSAADDTDTATVSV